MFLYDIATYKHNTTTLYKCVTCYKCWSLITNLTCQMFGVYTYLWHSRVHHFVHKFNSINVTMHHPFTFCLFVCLLLFFDHHKSNVNFLLHTLQYVRCTKKPSFILPVSSIPFGHLAARWSRVLLYDVLDIHTRIPQLVLLFFSCKVLVDDTLWYDSW